MSFKRHKSIWLYCIAMLTFIFSLLIQLDYMLEQWNLFNESISYVNLINPKQTGITTRINDTATNYQHSHADHSICDMNPGNILLGAHHKTGTVLLTSFIKGKINKYITKKCTNSPQKSTTKIATSLGLNQYQINNFISQHDINKDKIVIINMIRSPIDTILSGYNYHLNPPDHETWLKTPLYEMLNWADNILAFRKRRGKQIIDTRQTKLKCQSLTMLKTLNSTGITNTFEDVDFTIYNMYHQYNLSIGLHLEYNRYFTCEYDDIYESYKKLNELSSIGDENIVAKNIELEKFMGSQKSYDIALRNILKTIGINHKNDMNHLMNKLAKTKINRAPKTSNHVTDGKYNKTLQIKVLLSNIEHCHKLRNKTRTLGYEWEYMQYC